VQCRRNLVYSMSSAFNWTIKKLNKTKQHVSFATQNTVRLYKDHKELLMITYNSGSNGNYLSKKDRIKAGLPILQPSARMVGVANGGTSQAQHVTRLPFHKLSAWARQADTFQDFPMLLMSVGKTFEPYPFSLKQASLCSKRRMYSSHASASPSSLACKMEGDNTKYS
jgi:hypothetical protein